MLGRIKYLAHDLDRIRDLHHEEVINEPRSALFSTVGERRLCIVLVIRDSDPEINIKTKLF